jgi:high-affinity iron transporter
MFSTFLIALREGLEASLIVSILIAYLSRTGRAAFARYIWIGVGGAVALSFGLGALLSFTSANLSSNGEALFAGVTSVLAVSFVTVMVFWMKRTARGLGRELQSRVDDALPLGGFALLMAAFFAVAREGLETALFIYTNFKAVGSQAAPSIGLTAGLATSVTLGALIYRKTVKLNLGKFFTVTGYGLIIVAGGVLSHAIAEFQSRGDLPGASSLLWNQGDGKGVLWTIIDGSVGIGAQMSYLQLAIWATYLAVVISLYRRPVKASTPQSMANAH